MTTSGGMIRAGDVVVALALLSRYPVPAADWSRGARSGWAWPMAGALIAIPAAAIAELALSAGLPATVAAGLSLAALALATGAMHEDGLADCADGFWGGTTPERRLEIMKDSRIGSYGTLALVLGTGLRWSALAAVLGSGAGWQGMIVAAILSRAAMGPVMAFLPQARPGGLSASQGAMPGATAWMGVAIAVAICWVLTGVPPVLPLIGAAVAAGGIATLAVRKIGGQTGDVLGAVQVVSEIAVLCVLIA